MSPHRRDPPGGVSPTVIAAAVALAAALLLPSLSRGVDLPASAPAACAAPAPRAP